MIVYVNGDSVNFDGNTIRELLVSLGLPDNGVAVAIDMDIISRSDWNTYILNENSNITVIRAASGG